jgi:hypothetical protein
MAVHLARVDIGIQLCTAGCRVAAVLWICVQDVVLQVHSTCIAAKFRSLLL